jgi:RNA polymerase sigma factor (sigma-70 family)
VGHIRRVEADQPHYPSDALAEAILGPAEVQIFENLYAAYADDARRVAYGLLRDQELAADAAHTAFLELLRYILAGKRWHEPAEARAAVLRNTNWAALKILRSRRRRSEAALLVGEEPASGDVVWARAEARAVCEQVVGRLRRSQQVVLRLHFIEGMSSAQAGAQLGIGANAFDARLNRAVRSARRIAHSLGLVSLLLLAGRVVLRRHGQARLRLPSGSRALTGARLTATFIGVGFTSGAVTAVAMTSPSTSDAVAASRAIVHHVATEPSLLPVAPLDTPEDSWIIDGVALSPGTAVLLGEGRTCACGVIFMTHDAGRTWSATRGPGHVSPADRLLISSDSGSLEVVVVESDGPTYSLAGLGDLLHTSLQRDDVVHASHSQSCSAVAGGVLCQGRWVPISPAVANQGPGWVLAFQGAALVYVEPGQGLLCSTDGGISWTRDCGVTRAGQP